MHADSVCISVAVAVLACNALGGGWGLIVGEEAFVALKGGRKREGEKEKEAR